MFFEVEENSECARYFSLLVELCRMMLCCGQLLRSNSKRVVYVFNHGILARKIEDA